MPSVSKTRPTPVPNPAATLDRALPRPVLPLPVLPLNVNDPEDEPGPASVADNHQPHRPLFDLSGRYYGDD